MHRHAATLIFIALIAAFAYTVPTAFRLEASSSGGAIIGYAWSDTIGWIDLHCSNTDSCATNDFGLAIASNGDLSGYAWSDNVGWISANAADLDGCPSGSCKAKISGVNLQGWMRALAADGDGWDGWISLSGSGYGPTISGGSFSGYAWGSDVVGWVDWSLADTNYTPCDAYFYCADNDVRYQDGNCVDTFIETCSYQCASGACVAPPAPSFNPGSGGLTGHLQAQPALVPFNSSTRLYWDLSDVESCTVTGTNGDAWNADTSTAAGVETSAIVAQTDFTLACTGLDESEIEETVTVRLVPIFNEF